MYTVVVSSSGGSVLAPLRCGAAGVVWCGTADIKLATVAIVGCSGREGDCFYYYCCSSLRAFPESFLVKFCDHLWDVNTRHLVVS